MISADLEERFKIQDSFHADERDLSADLMRFHLYLLAGEIRVAGGKNVLQQSV
jgi:hypothetical protein